MRFEPIKKPKKDSKLQKFIAQFISSKHEEVEVFNENDYESNAQLTASLRFAAKKYFPEDNINISRSKDRVFMKKTK